MTRILIEASNSDAANGNKFNDRCITKLLANFRSHEVILDLPSKLFYNSELITKGDPALINSLTRWEHLPMKGRPVIFHGVYGSDKREERSPSYFNPEEIVVVVDYVEKLLSNKQKVNYFVQTLSCLLWYDFRAKFL